MQIARPSYEEIEGTIANARRLEDHALILCVTTRQTIARPKELVGSQLEQNRQPRTSTTARCALEPHLDDQRLVDVEWCQGKLVTIVSEIDQCGAVYVQAPSRRSARLPFDPR